MQSSLRPSSQRDEIMRRHKIGQAAFLQIPPLAVLAEDVADGKSVRPASLRLATIFDPMNPAPPVTNSIQLSWTLRATIALVRVATQLGPRLRGLTRRPFSKITALHDVSPTIA